MRERLNDLYEKGIGNLKIDELKEAREINLRLINFIEGFLENWEEKNE